VIIMITPDFCLTLRRAVWGRRTVTAVALARLGCACDHGLLGLEVEDGW
jgi:hypothetical protein